MPKVHHGPDPQGKCLPVLHARWGWSLVFGSAAAIVSLAFLALSWAGHLPYGRDIDEYLGVAESLYCTGRPVVAGYERTRYPLLYPVILGLPGLLGIPIAHAGIALNYLAFALLLVWLFRHNLTLPLGGFLAVIYLVTTQILWALLQLIYTEILFLAGLIPLMILLPKVSRIRHLFLLSLATTYLAGLRAVGLIPAIACSIHLGLRHRNLRRWSWIPAGLPTALLVLQSLWYAHYPRGTMDYLKVFTLADPYDSAAGQATLFAVLIRPVRNLGWSLNALGHLLGGHFPAVFSIPLMLSVLFLAIVFAKPLRIFLTAFAGLYSLTILYWPFREPRFWLPLLAVGVTAWYELGRRLDLRRQGHRVLFAGIMIFFTARGAADIRHIQTHRDWHRSKFTLLYRETQALADWVKRRISPSERIISQDFRELALRLERPVMPLGYSTDPDLFLLMVLRRGPRWFIASDLVYPPIRHQSRRMLTKHRRWFIPRYRNPAFHLYRVRSPGGASGNPPTTSSKSRRPAPYPIRICLPTGFAHPELPFHP